MRLHMCDSIGHHRSNTTLTAQSNFTAEDIEFKELIHLKYNVELPGYYQNKFNDNEYNEMKIMYNKT
eukprot:5700888-Amphidinium_carterae.2